MSGPSLRTWEFADWARSRKLALADEEQLRAVFLERDRLFGALENLIVDAELAGRMFGVGLSLDAAQSLIAEVSP